LGGTGHYSSVDARLVRANDTESEPLTPPHGCTVARGGARGDRWGAGGILPVLDAFRPAVR